MLFLTCILASRAKAFELTVDLALYKSHYDDDDEDDDDDDD